MESSLRELESGDSEEFGIGDDGESLIGEDKSAAEVSLGKEKSSIPHFFSRVDIDLA